MADTYRSLLGTIDMVNGSGNWGEKLDGALDTLEHAIAGVTIIQSTGGAKTLASGQNVPAESNAATIHVKGALTEDLTVTVPNLDKIYACYNSTTGGSDVYIKRSGEAGAGVILAQGSRGLVLVLQDGDTGYVTPTASQDGGFTPSVDSINGTHIQDGSLLAENFDFAELAEALGYAASVTDVPNHYPTPISYANEAAMLASTVPVGYMIIRADQSNSPWIRVGAGSTISSWAQAGTGGLGDVGGGITLLFASIATMLAAGATKGALAFVEDIERAFALTAADGSDIANWESLFKKHSSGATAHSPAYEGDTWRNPDDGALYTYNDGAFRRGSGTKMLSVKSLFLNGF